MNYLSPLIMAYDDTLRDKNEVIRAYEVCLIVLLILVVFALVDAITLKENCKARTIFPCTAKESWSFSFASLEKCKPY